MENFTSLPIGTKVLNNPTLWYLENKNHTFTYNPVKIEDSPFVTENRFGGTTNNLNSILEYEDGRRPLYETINCFGYSGLLLFTGSRTNNLTIKAVNNTADGVDVLVYDLHQNWTKTLPVKLVKSDDNNQRYYFEGTFDINSNEFILIGGRGTNTDVTEIKLT